MPAHHQERLAVIPAHHEALVEQIRELFAAGPLPPDWSFCNVFWRSHGCDLPADHLPPHVCICDLGRPSWDLPAPPAGIAVPFLDDTLYDVFGRPLT